MKKIVVLGAGVMGSAICIPAAQHQENDVTLVGSPLDDSIIDELKNGCAHPKLGSPLPESVKCFTISDVDHDAIRSADIIIFGVSSPGVEWACNVLNHHDAAPTLLALVTKGLVAPADCSVPPLTYADALDASLTNPVGNIVGIGGPCIAQELAQRLPTCVTFASAEIDNAVLLQETLQTDYYRVSTHSDIVAVEACAALKNFLCIGVSSMLTRNASDNSYAKNPLAALFNQAVIELDTLSRWIGRAIDKDESNRNVAFDLAGMGDLHVTVGGGRNSRLGALLGQGRHIADVMNNELRGVTVEGVDTGRQLYDSFNFACDSGQLDRKQLPLTDSILKAIVDNALFNFDFTLLPAQGRTTKVSLS